MSLREQIVNTKIDEISSKLGVDKNAAFTRFVYSLVLDKSFFDFNARDIVDGSQDKQIDIVSIEEGKGDVVVTIVQVKNSIKFGSSEIVKLNNGLQYFFLRDRSDVESICNVPLRDKILEYRSVQNSIGPANIKVYVYFVAKGNSKNLSKEFRQEVSLINREYNNNTFCLFEFRVYGSDELVDLLNFRDKKDRMINVDLPIRYSSRKSLLGYESHGLKGVICTVLASEIATIINSDQHGAAFDLNLRRFLGDSAEINKSIYDTCSDGGASFQFWFLNNGITVVCDKFDVVLDGDFSIVKIFNFQIVNGCQTASVLAKAQRDGVLCGSVHIVLRIYETHDRELVNRIVYTTNNQNKITNRDLRANDSIQIDLERAFFDRGYFYERTPRQFDRMCVQMDKLVNNEFVAQSYLAVFLKRPSDARRRKYKVWSDYYCDIFNGHQVERFIFSLLLARDVERWLVGTGYFYDNIKTKRKIAKNSSFHLSLMAATIQLGCDPLKASDVQLSENIDVLSDPGCIDQVYEQSFVMLEKIIVTSDVYKYDIDNALKSSDLDSDICRALEGGGPFDRCKSKDIPELRQESVSIRKSLLDLS